MTGRGHPMFAGKKTCYEAFMSHGDEVTRVPPAGIVLSGNDHTRVQSMCVARAGVESWFVQYHPEYDLDYFSRLIGTRTGRMVSQGFFKTEEEVARYISDLQELHAAVEERRARRACIRAEFEWGGHGRKDIAWRYGIDEDILSNDIKRAEPVVLLRLLQSTHHGFSNGRSAFRSLWPGCSFLRIHGYCIVIP